MIEQAKTIATESNLSDPSVEICTLDAKLTSFASDENLHETRHFHDA